MKFAIQWKWAKKIWNTTTQNYKEHMYQNALKALQTSQVGGDIAE